MFCISPDYIHALKKESDPYSFHIQGYSTFELAYKNLYKTNFKDILGFIFLSDSLRKIDTNDLKDFLECLDELPDIDKMTFLISLKDMAGLTSFLESISIRNLRLKVMDKYEMVTDTIIRACFGCILKDTVECYVDGKPRISHSYDVGNSLSYYLLFNNSFHKVVSDVVMFNTLENTLNNDSYLLENRDEEDLYFCLRKAYISAFFGIHTDLTAVCKEYETIFLNDDKNDDDFYITLMCVCNMIKDIEEKSRGDYNVIKS